MWYYIGIGMTLLSCVVFYTVYSNESAFKCVVDTYSSIRKTSELMCARFMFARDVMNMSHDEMRVMIPRPFCDAVGVIPECIMDSVRDLPLVPSQTSKWTLKTIVKATDAPVDTEKIVIYFPPAYVIERSIAASVYVKWDVDRVEFT